MIKQVVISLAMRICPFMYIVYYKLHSYIDNANWTLALVSCDSANVKYFYTKCLLTHLTGGGE